MALLSLLLPDNAYPLWLSAGAVTFCLVLYKLIIYPVFLSPLASLPAAHPLCHVTSLWMQWQRYNEREFSVVAAAFARKGDYVRLGPREMAVNSVEGVQCAYGVGAHNFDRHKSYLYFVNHGSQNMFGSLAAADQSPRRRRIAHVYNKPFLQTSPHVRAILREILLGRVLPSILSPPAADTQSDWKGTPAAPGATSTKNTAAAGIDVLPYMQYYILSFMSGFVFGLPRGFNHVTDRGELHRWMELFELIYPSDAMFWVMECSKSVRWFVHKVLRCKVLPDGHDEARKEFEDWAVDKVVDAERVLSRVESGEGEFEAGHLPVVLRAVRNGVARDAGYNVNECGAVVIGDCGVGRATEKGGAKAAAPFNPDWAQTLELASECLDHLVAAREAFGTFIPPGPYYRGITSTFLLYQISRHPDIQEALHQELLSAQTLFSLPESATEFRSAAMPAPDVLERLPLLNGIIRETLRLRNNQPNMDPRATPAGTKSSVGPLKNLPPGIRVGYFAWLVHRRNDLYPDALQWNPWRWLDGSEKNGMSKQSFFAFGRGPRGCVGQHVAIELMRHLVAAIYTNYKSGVADETLYPGTKGMVAVTGKHKLHLKFERR